VIGRRAAAALTLLVLAACGKDAAEGPGDVRVEVGVQDVTARPVQYCQDGERVRYTNAPPVVEVSPDAVITLTVPESVAERGWGVQVFDEGLEEILGEVDVPAGEDQLTEINTSDVVPPAFYLVIVEDKGGDCGEWSGAWPVGFVRAGGDLGATPSSSAPPAG
jgi:hypothetical protein